MKKPSYREIQRQFFRLISQPRPITEVNEGSSPLVGWIQAPDEQVAAARLGIYQHMYFARLRDSLREDFALVARLLPARSFDRIAARYLERHPSMNPSLRYHGRYFPQFLQYSLLQDEPATRELRPDAPDLACLEWARLDAFDAPNSTPLLRDEWLELAQSGSGELLLHGHPSVRLIETRFCVSALWQAVESERPYPQPELGPEHVLVWRRELRVYHRTVSDEEGSALRLLLRGATIEALCECFASPAFSPEECALRAFAALEQWLVDELVTIEKST